MTHLKTNFLDFLLEYNQKMNEGDPTQNKETIVKDIPWSFNFDSGKFGLADIPESDLAKIYSDFEKNILPVLTDVNYIGQKMNLKLVASTSKVPLGPAVAKQLISQKYEGNNKGLAKARLDTLASIVEELLFKYFKGEKEEREKFMKGLSDKVSIIKRELPNQGPAFKTGDDPKSDEFKKFQKLSAVISVYGEKIPDDQKLKCNTPLSGKGGKGLAEKLYCGYDKNVYALAKKGTKMEISFDPFTVPDSFIYSYMDEVKLSPFAGSHGGLLLQPFDQKTFNDLIAKAESAGTEKVVKEKIKGVDYIVYPHKRILNEVYNKNNQLVNAINKKLKQMGEMRDIKEVQPAFFDKEGKIEVYALDIQKGVDSGVQQLVFTAKAIKEGIIPSPPMIAKETLSFTLTKDFKRDYLKLAVFSPLGGTSFSLKAKCTPPPTPKAPK